MSNELEHHTIITEEVFNNISEKPLLSKKFFRLILFFLLLIWSAGFSINAFFPNSEAAILYPVLKKIYSTVCHQDEHKLINIFSGDFLVCARCTGIYLGALVISFISLFGFRKIQNGKKFLLILFSPLIIDVLLSSLGVYSYSKLIAFCTGLFFGSVLFIYILFPLENFFLNSDNKDAL